MAFKLKSQHAVKAHGFKCMGSSSPLKDRDPQPHTHDGDNKWYETTSETILNDDGSKTTKYHRDGSQGGGDKDAVNAYAKGERRHSSGGSYEKVWKKMSDEDKKKAGGFAKWYKEAKAWNTEQLRRAQDAENNPESGINPLSEDWEETIPAEDTEDPGGSGGGATVVGLGDGGKKRKKNKKNRGGGGSGSGCDPLFGCGAYD